MIMDGEQVNISEELVSYDLSGGSKTVFVRTDLKPTNSLSRDRRKPTKDLNRTSPVYKAIALPP
jgi:hypothetical protein